MRHLILSLIFALAASSVVAKPPLRDVAEIDDAVFAVGLANEIRKNCPTISARTVKAVITLRSLVARANDLGYSDDEIEAYRNSDAEKARLRAQGKVWFEARGVDADVPESYCAAGREEIEKDSQIGTLLKVD